MPSKAYFAFIAHLQEALLWVGVATLLVLPVLAAYLPELLPDTLIPFLFALSLTAAFLVMSIRPLADLFPGIAWLRPLVILRKGFGVLSAAIIVAFMLSKVMLGGMDYLAGYFAPHRWAIANGAILAPLGDWSALILLATSNRFAKRILGKGWKRVQKLAYVYFYAGALYEWLLLGQAYAFWYLLIVAGLSIGAYVGKRITPRPAFA